MQRKKSNNGITLLEIMLVLAVASAILLLSTQQYLSYRRTGDITQLQSNVNVLFDALANYYRANCAKQDHPLYEYSPGKVLQVTVDELSKEGFTTFPGGNVPLSPLVNADSPGKGYILQFNQYQVNNKLPTRTQAMSSGGSVNVGSVIIWQAQVAVNLLNSETAMQYKNSLGANCLSTSTGSGVTPCTSSVGSGNYAVFNRPPSQPSSGSTGSVYWYTNPNTKLFKQMYTTDPILVLTDQTQTASQYYVCGS